MGAGEGAGVDEGEDVGGGGSAWCIAMYGGPNGTLAEERNESERGKMARKSFARWFALIPLRPFSCFSLCLDIS